MTVDSIHHKLYNFIDGRRFFFILDSCYPCLMAHFGGLVKQVDGLEKASETSLVALNFASHQARHSKSDQIYVVLCGFPVWAYSCACFYKVHEESYNR